MRDLQKTYEKARQLCINAGLPIGTVVSVTVNRTALRRWGQCKIALPGFFHININADLLKETNPESALMNTLIHELIHTCKGCMNHGWLWKYYANIINSKYGFDITRVSSAEKQGVTDLRKIANKYSLKCDACGRIWNRAKASKFVSHPEFYRCSCGGKITRIK